MVSFAKIKNGALSELIAHKKNRVVSALLFGFAGLFYAFNISGENWYYPSGMALFLYGAALICLLSACVNVFRDMHDIPSADVQMSMPLTGAERYFSRLLTIVYIWVLPFAVSAVCAFIPSMFTAFAGSGSSAAGAVKYVAGYSLKLLVGYIETALYIIAVAVIYQCCTGPKNDSYYMPVLLIMALLTVLPIMLYIAVNALFFNSYDLNINSLKPLLNPMLFFIFDDHAAAEDFILSAVRSLVYLAATGCSVFIYKKRNAPIVFTVFLEIAVGLSLLIFFAFFHVREGFSLTAMLFIWLGSIILRAVASRERFSPKVFFRWTGMYLVHYGVFLLFMFIAFKTNGFGTVCNIPDISDLRKDGIREITVSIYTPDDGQTRYGTEYSKTAAANNKEDIRAFMELTVSKAKMQSSLNKIYFREMFGHKLFVRETRNESCYVSVYFASWTHSCDDHNRKSCFIDFYIPRSEKEKFIREFEEFDGFEFMEAYQNVYYG